MKTILSIFTVLMLFTIVVFAMLQVGAEVINNDNIDNESKTFIADINEMTYRDFNYSSDFSESSSTLAENSTFNDASSDARSYLEGKYESNNKIGIVSSISKAPDLILISLGIDEEDAKVYKAIILLIISTLVGFALYRALFGTGRID